MSEDGALFDARFDDGGPFRDTPDAGGISLESALNDYGPAAIDDLIPRVRALASILDTAHRTGVVHGALHPSKVFVSDDATSIVKGAMASAPYIAPEVAGGGAPTPASDLFSLAAIAYEWLFGRKIDGPAYRTVDVKPMPGVDRSTLAKAFSRALAPAPEVRFASCAEFCNALADATTPELPLLAVDEDDEDEDDVDAVGPFLPEQPEPAAPTVDDMMIGSQEPTLAAASFDPDDGALLDQDRPADVDPVDPVVPRIEPTPVPSWNPPPLTQRSDSQRFGGLALVLAAIVGAVFGFAAGYMARPRALQSGPVETFAAPPAASASTAKPVEKSPAARAPAASAPPEKVQADKAPEKTAPAKPAVAESKPVEAPKPTPASAGRLLIRSTPSGATVLVDGIEKGTTPLALRDVEYGTHTITISQRGYQSQSQRVAVSASRPSRSLDVRLSAPPAAVPKPSTPATLGRPAATTGSLNVDSRPAGAAVSINGKPSGVTPLTINDLPPGDYRVQMSKPGYRNFATTVRVVAGERVRAAYSLTAQEQE